MLLLPNFPSIFTKYAVELQSSEKSNNNERITKKGYPPSSLTYNLMKQVFHRGHAEKCRPTNKVQTPKLLSIQGLSSSDPWLCIKFTFCRSLPPHSSSLHLFNRSDTDYPLLCKGFITPFYHTVLKFSNYSSTSYHDHKLRNELHVTYLYNPSTVPNT